eukprot:4793013-Pyramimonas_sp.AAC.1
MLFVLVGCSCASWGRAPSSDLMVWGVIASGGSHVLEGCFFFLRSDSIRIDPNGRQRTEV